MAMELFEMEENYLLAKEQKISKAEETLLNSPIEIQGGFQKSNTFLLRMATKRTEVLEEVDNILVRNKTVSMVRQKTNGNTRISNVA